MTTPDPYAGFQPKNGSSPTGAVDPNAVQLFNANDAVRKEIAQLLKNAGYKINVTGKYSSELLAAYTDAVQHAAEQSQRIGRSVTVRDYLTQEWKANAGSGSGSSGITNYISDPTQAAGTVQAVVQGLLGREATTKETDALSKILVDAQKKNPYKTTNGVRTGGLDDKQFLTDLIINGTYDANKKMAPGLLKNLAEEAKTKKTGAEEKVRLTNEQAIRNTATSNGIKLSDSQLKAYVDGVKAGKSLEETQQDIRHMASLGMPDNIKKLIQGGTDLDTIYSPYKRVMASSLDINPDTIDLNDPTLRMAIGPDKEMSLYDYQKAVRKDNRWKYSQEANDEVTSMINQVKRDFGFMG